MSLQKEMWSLCPCGCEEYTENTVVEHVELVHPELLFKCHVNHCGRLLWKLSDLTEHIEKSDTHSNFRKDHESLFKVEEFLDKQSRSYTRRFLGLKVSNSTLVTEGLIGYPVDLKEYRCRVCKANRTHFCCFLWSSAIRHFKTTHPEKFAASFQQHIKYKCRECGRDDFCNEWRLQTHIDGKHVIGRSLQTHVDGKHLKGRSLQTHIDGKHLKGRSLQTHIDGKHVIGRSLQTHIDGKHVIGRSFQGHFEGKRGQSQGRFEDRQEWGSQSHFEGKCSQPQSLSEDRQELERSLQRYAERKWGQPQSRFEDRQEWGFEGKRSQPPKISTRSRLSETIKTDSEPEIEILEVKYGSASNEKTGSWYKTSTSQQRGPSFLPTSIKIEPDEGEMENCLPCSFCKLRVPESSFHLKIHYEKLFKCDICQLGFEDYGKVEKHLKNIHRVEDCRSLICLPMEVKSLAMMRCGVEDCDRKFIGQENQTNLLIEHITRTHGHHTATVDNMLFLCRICGNLRRFESLSEVEEHIKNKHPRQLVTINSNSEEETEEVSPMSQRERKDDDDLDEEAHSEEPAKKVRIIEKLSKRTSKEKKKRQKESTKDRKRKQKKTEKSHTKVSQKATNELKPNISNQRSRSKSCKTKSRKKKVSVQPKWPQLIKEVPTAAIKELLENVTTATVVASTIRKRLKRNKSKSHSKTKSSSSSVRTKTSTSSESETDEDSEISSYSGKGSTSNSNSGTSEELELRKRKAKAKSKRKPKVCRAEKTLVKRTSITLEKRLAYCLDKDKTEVKISEITGEAFEKNKQPILDKRTTGTISNDEDYSSPSDMSELGGEILTQSKECPNPTQTLKHSKTGVAPTLFYCEFCGKQFHYSSSICVHIYKDHRLMLFRCKMCTSQDMLVSGFVQARGLTKHLRKGHRLKGLPDHQLLGNEDLVEWPHQFLQKIVCVSEGCSESEEIGRTGLWLGRDLVEVRDEIMEHSLLTHKTSTDGVKIELQCRACTKFREVYSRNDEDQVKRWRTHCAQNHVKLINF